MAELILSHPLLFESIFFIALCFAFGLGFGVGFFLKKLMVMEE